MADHDRVGPIVELGLDRRLPGRGIGIGRVGQLRKRDIVASAPKPANEPYLPVSEPRAVEAVQHDKALAQGPLPLSIRRFHARWRRSASRSHSGSRRIARPGMRSNSRTKTPAVAGDRQNHARLVEQARDRPGDHLGTQQHARERGRRVAVVELVEEHWRPDAVRADRGYVDLLRARSAKVGECAEGERHRRVLRRGVERLARRRREAGERDHVDQVAAVGGSHLLKRRK